MFFANRRERDERTLFWVAAHDVERELDVLFLSLAADVDGPPLLLMVNCQRALSLSISLLRVSLDAFN